MFIVKSMLPNSFSPLLSRIYKSRIPGCVAVTHAWLHCKTNHTAFLVNLVWVFGECVERIYVHRSINYTDSMEIIQKMCSLKLQREATLHCPC